MSETTPTATAEIKPTAPLPENNVVAYADASGVERTDIDRALAEIVLEDSNSILFFGSSAQTEASAGSAARLNTHGRRARPA